jgi:hypothetical protein
MDWWNITLTADGAVADWECEVIDRTDEVTKATRRLLHALQEGLWALHVEGERPLSDIWQPKRILAENKSRPLWPPPDDDPFGKKPNTTTFSSS